MSYFSDYKSYGYSTSHGTYNSTPSALKRISKTNLKRRSIFHALLFGALPLLSICGGFNCPASAAEQISIRSATSANKEGSDFTPSNVEEVNSATSTEDNAPPVMLSIQPSLAKNKRIAAASANSSPNSSPSPAQPAAPTQTSGMKLPNPPDSTQLGKTKSIKLAPHLEPDARLLGNRWNIIPELEKIEALSAAAPSERNLEHRNEYLESKQTILQEIMSAMFDVRRTLNSIDRHKAHSQEARAIMMERRDRAIRYNTYADLVAGGITGILSGAFHIAGLSEVIDGTIDVTEGATQTGLAGWALKNEHVEHDFIQGVPNILATIIYPDDKRGPEFPDSVWIYLNTVPAHSLTGLTRREVLVKKWLGRKFCMVHQGHKLHHMERSKKITGMVEKPSLSIDVLEDRSAMLEDLRVVVSLMDEPLGQLLNYSRKF